LAREQLAQVKTYRNIVAEYDHWKKTSWSRYEQMSGRVTQCDLDVQTCSKMLSDAVESFNKKRREGSERLNALNDQAKLLRRDVEEGEGALRQLPSFFGSDQAINENELPSLHHLIALATSLVQEQKTLMTTIRTGIQRAENIICVGSDSSRLRRAWDALRTEVRSTMADPDDYDAYVLNMTWALDRLMTTQLPQIREGDLVAVLNAGHQVKGFYSDLVAAQDVIAHHARRVSQEIVACMDFESISDIRINLINRIKEQDYWSDLRGFVEAWDKWEMTQVDDFPPDNLCADLMAIAEVLGRSSLRDSMDSVFDLNISLIENGRPVVVRTTAEMVNASSTGLTYLILLSIYAGITRMLCPDREVVIHWPVDELAVIAYPNLTPLFSMLDQQGIVMVGGFPSSERGLMQHFKHHHGVRKSEGLVKISMPPDRLDLLLKKAATKSAPSTASAATEGEVV